MKQYEYSAKNVQEAINKGLSELGRKQEDVDIKVLAEGGLFSKAKILIITDEVEEVKPEPVKEVKTEVKKEEKKETKKEEPKVEQVKEKKQKIKNSSLENKKSVEFIKTLAEKLEVEVAVTLTEEDENLLVDLSGEKAGHLIGYRGEGLSAIQYIASVIEINSEEKETRKRILLNIEKYKEKREQALTNLAQRMAKKAIRTGRSQRLEPMNAYERRIIHAALTDEPVTTYSKGDEPRRFLVIDPKQN
jgi:spoIIIJ-associated protein